LIFGSIFYRFAILFVCAIKIITMHHLATEYLRTEGWFIRALCLTGIQVTIRATLSILDQPRRCQNPYTTSHIPHPTSRISHSTCPTGGVTVVHTCSIIGLDTNAALGWLRRKSCLLGGLSRATAWSAYPTQETIVCAPAVPELLPG
jgi:hypothetical protein